MPTVSIVLTSFNHEKFIAQAIDSVLAQTFTDYELIIADDCSTDNSWEIIQSYKDSRIRAIRSPENLRTKNFYNAIHSGRGKYLAVHHSDDIWLPEKLEKQVRHLEAHPEHAAVFTRGRYINDQGILYPESMSQWFNQENRSRHEWLRDFFFKGNLLCHPTVLMHYEHSRKIHTRYGPTAYNDWMLWIKTCLEKEIYIIQEDLFHFRLVDYGKGNDGGVSLGTSLRFEIDLPWALELYRRINSLEDWKLVFPECEEYIVDGCFEPDYFFAIFCLQQEDRPARIYYALNLLMRALNDPVKRERLHKLYGFTPAKMAKLVVQHDPFGLSARTALAKAQAELMETRKGLAAASGSLCATQHDLATTRTDLAETHTSLAATRAELAEAHTSLATTRADLAEAHTSLAATRAELAEAHTSLATTRTDLAETHTSLATTRAELAEAHTSLATARADLVGVRANLTETGIALAEARAALGSTSSALTLAETNLVEKTILLDAIMSSRSWRIVTKLRGIRKLFRNF